ncbi:MAG: hypothetical protein ACYC27_05430 [Armatimonadota bacterium]
MNQGIIVLLCLTCFLPSSAFAAFGGKPPLGPQDGGRREFAPYTMVELNYLGMNYCENLIDMRSDIISYTHQNFDSNAGDAWHLQFPDDAARLLEGVAWEADFSPVARLEFARRIDKGLISAHLPDTKGYNSFRYRIGGKTLLIFDDDQADKQGRLTLSTWGDAIGGECKVGFRVQNAGKWHEIDQFKYTETPKDAAKSGAARSSVGWNQSPYTFNRRFTLDGKSVDFTGRYWMSDEDMPIEYRFSSRDADNLQIVVGEPDKPMPLLNIADPNAAGVIHLPDRKTTFQSDKTGDKVFSKPDFNYLILRKGRSWTGPGYSTALLVMWDGKPEYIEAKEKFGYGEIRVSYPKVNGKAGGRVWLYPFSVVNDDDMDYIYRNAENFLKKGKLIHNGFPTQQSINAIPAGLAAGAYILTKYNDPMAPTARINARNAVDEVFEAEIAGKVIYRVFFPVRAAAWMVKTGKVLGDQAMVDKYSAMLDIAMNRMLSPAVGYNGSAWPSGWEHFNATKAAWLAYDATGNDEYRKAWERALAVYTIDENGIYRDGKPMADPGGFNTYFGSMPMGVWGNAGKLDWVEKLINLDVPSSAGEKSKAKDMWHDDGNGPWAQDDANPEYVGLALKGLNIPQDKKYIIPVGAFPIYDEAGNVEITRSPILENPFFLAGKDKMRVIDGTKNDLAHNVTQTVVTPGTGDEKAHIVQVSGKIDSGHRVCTGTDKPLVYKFDSSGATGAGIDIRMKGDGFRIEVSPDGKRWYERLDTWSSDSRDQSVDVSFFTGSRDQLLKTLYITPAADKSFLVNGNKSVVKNECRYAQKDGSIVYRLDMPDAVESYLELLAGNGYVIECSSDGKTWRKEIDAGDYKAVADAAWFRMVDVSSYLRNGKTVFVRVSNMNDTSAYGGKNAFLRRLTAYNVLKTDNIFVRISNVYKAGDRSFDIEKITFRKWSD